MWRGAAGEATKKYLLRLFVCVTAVMQLFKLLIVVKEDCILQIVQPRGFFVDTTINCNWLVVVELPGINFS